MTTVHYPGWRAVGIAAVLLIVPSLLGLLAAFAINEHGSIAFLVLGIWLGIAASIIYLGAYLVRRYLAKRITASHGEG
jgi:hypothetical protein